MTGSGRRTTARIGSALAALFLVAACGSGDETPPDPAAEASIDAAAPETEATAFTEAPGETGAGAVAVELPGLPIGGSTSVLSDTLQCVDVGWTEPPDLPGWMGIAVTGVGFSPAEGFAVSTETCPGAASCLDPGFRLTVDGPRCAVAVTWTGPTLEEERLMFFTSGVLVCPAERLAECEAFRAAVAAGGARAIALDPAPSEFGATEPSVPDEVSSAETLPVEPSSAPTADASD